MAFEGKLFPPKIDKTLPACVIPSEHGVAISLLIPFELNRGVSWVDLASQDNVSLMIKTVSTGKTIVDGLQGEVIKLHTETNTPVAQFEIDKEEYKLEPGMFYKVQIAFISKSNLLGYYSDVGVIKMTSEPKLKIKELEEETDSNQATYEYTGIYENEDYGEKVYSYEFIIMDNTTGLVHDRSGVKIHNSSNDTERGKSYDTWTSFKTFQTDRQYSIVYKVTTVNNLKAETGAYGLLALETLDLVSRNTDFIATLNADDAYVHIHILPKDVDAEIKAITGNFILVRASSEDNFQSWNEIYKFTLINNYPLATLWKDFTVQQGHSYKYAVQAYNAKKVYSNRLECKYYLSEMDERKDDISRRNWNSNSIDPLENTNLKWHYIKTNDGLPVDFEDAFLYDGERQLKIRYNPKISSFKNTILESKIDTIGSQHPFIFRNGNTNYKEFPISGLITLLSDENFLFFDRLKRDELNRKYSLIPPYEEAMSGWWYNITGLSESLLRKKQESEAYESLTSLTAENFRREREFKIEVLNWLTNGKPKLFRSPGEGNYIVRLMNTSLTPNDTTGRMLHTFQSTAYEIAECSFKNLENYNFINARNTDYQELKFKMVDIFKTYEKEKDINLVIDGGAYYFTVLDQYGFWSIEITYANGKSVIVDCSNSTGQYVIDPRVLKDNPIISIATMEGAPDVEAKILYGYYDTSDIAFSLISNIVRDTVIEQIIGHPKLEDRDDSFNINYVDTIKNGVGYKQSEGIFKKYGNDNIPKKTLGKFYYLKAEPREVTDIYFKNDKYYYTPQCLHQVLNWDDSSLYKVYKESGGNWVFYKQYSGRPSNNILLENPSYLLRINASPNNGESMSQESFVDLSLRGSSALNAPITSGRYEVYFDLDKVENINIGSGLKCQVSYNTTTLNFEAEENENFSTLIGLKQSWEESKNQYKEFIRQGNSEFSSQGETLRKSMEEVYHRYLRQLKVTLDNIQKEGNTYYVL